MIDYDHQSNRHTLEGPRHALSALLPRLSVQSMLDVGCGRGTWLKAAKDCGIQETVGVDGVSIPVGELHFAPADFHVRDLTQPLDLGRRFDLALCLEVAEHLEEIHAQQLVANLTRHADTVLFSAACPGQPGQHHVNCQWPMYWQGLFDTLGYVCVDSPRWSIWADSRIEPWYRQNLMLAKRNEGFASQEPRIFPVIHPEMHEAIVSNLHSKLRNREASRISDGGMPLSWYFRNLLIALNQKSFKKLTQSRLKCPE